MRRNRNFDNNHQASPGGPLLTNHLRDLDIELELLKRKRDIIQQEQAIINRYSSKRQFDYGHSSNTYNRQEPSSQQFNTNNFSARYDGPSSSGNFTRPQAPKRQTPNQYWQPPSSNKNFTPTQKINPWQTSMPKQNTGFSNQKKFQAPHPRNSTPAQIRPLMSIRPSIGQKVQKNFPRKDFKPNKVTKPKPQQAPNKLATYSHDQAKKLISQACDSADKKGEVDQILRADKTPTLQMKGRLELALGMIIKEIKTEHCTDPDDLEYFQSPFIQRLLKHTIRTRIRNVMIDQVVGNVNDIVANYRKKYPTETDIDLVQIAKDAQNLSSKTVGVAQLIESDDPEDFYKKNMVKALTTKLEEMLMNLEKLYMHKGQGLEERLEGMPEPNKGSEKEKKPEPNKTNPENLECSKTKINFENIVGEGENVLEAIHDKFSKVKYYTELMDELIEFRLPKILPKFKDMLLAIMLTDREFLGMKAMISSQIKKKLLKLTGQEAVGDTALDLPSKNKTKNTTDKFVPKTQTTTPDTNENTSAATNAANEAKSKCEPKVSLTTETIQESSVALSATSSEGPGVEPSTDTSDKSTSEPEKPVVALPKVSPTKPVTVASTTPTKTATEQITPATPKSSASTELLFVKLISRPALPARAVIYDFLNQFNPTSIKKHKSISNLLVIGFKNIEDYNKILTVNESVVGNATIVIKASEQVNKPKEPTPSQTEVDENAPKSADQSLADSSLLNSDLEHQISDLLTSIRKAEEQDRGDSDTKSDNKMDTSETNDSKTANEYSNAKNDDNLKPSGELGTTPAESQIDDSDGNKTNGDDKTKSDEKDTLNNDDGNSKEEEKEPKELETIAETTDEKKNEESTKPDNDKIKENLKESGRATPTRTSSRLANSTPSTIRTRRASRLL